jgi:hypothetical protein
MYFTGRPSYPFGYGLSYTRFRYSRLSVRPSRRVSANGTVRVGFTVRNTGRLAGATVAQLYAAPRFRSSTLALPIRQLVGFQRTRVLRPGQAQRVSLTVTVSDLGRWDESRLRKVVPDGVWRLELSTAAGDAVASRAVRVTGALAPRVRHVTVQPGHVVFGVGQTLDLTAKNPWIAPDVNARLEQPHAAADGIVEAVNDDQSFADLAKAPVTYRSDRPDVASVSDTGVIRAVAPGVATIDVTVGGVTGSTVIVVR